MYRTGLILVCILLMFTGIPGQAQSEPESYGSGFFDQLRSIFGIFRDSDLQRVFEESKPIQCSELVGRKGEWRPVAFFNEDRTLGDWCRENLDEVKADLAVYTFKGLCSGDRSPVTVGTEYPTAESVKAYRERRIDFDQVDITVNDPVEAVLDPKTMAYTFELPYLFLTEKGPKQIYSFIAPHRASTYAGDVTSRWECKTVSSKDVTYRFLICRVETVPQKKLAHNERWTPAFGSSAFFILSDGTEAQSSVNLTFGDAIPPSSDASAPKEAEPDPAGAAPKRPILKKR